MAITLYITGTIMVIATILPFLKSGLWWIRVFDFPRMQVALIAAVVIVLYTIFVRKYNWPNIGFLVAVLAAIVTQLIQIWPHTTFARVQTITALNPDRDNCVSLLIANVYQYNRSYETFLQQVEKLQPDIVIAAETDQWWAEKLSPIKSTYRYCLEQPQDNTYGMLFYSRLPVHDGTVQFLVNDAIPSVFAKVELKSGVIVDLYGVHPEPPHPVDNQNTIERDAELVVVSRLVQRAKAPAIVAGDLNDVAWSHTTRLFQRISQMLDPRIGRGLYNTFPTSIPFFRFPLDHVFHTADFELLKLERLPDIGSDHFPMYVSLCYNPKVEHLQDKPEKPDTADLKEAQETVEEARQKSDSGEL